MSHDLRAALRTSLVDIVRLRTCVILCICGLAFASYRVIFVNIVYFCIAMDSSATASTAVSIDSFTANYIDVI
jgi:hypothetical protein